MVANDGSVVGQVNGIAVLDPGDYAFGKPSRITARTFMGDAGVVNIGREVKMSGRIHNKALMILTSFLGERYAQTFPLALSATVTFEQMYEEIEGDSASCSETYALLSSLSGIPIDQAIAVTGSMNQMGEVQPIGGVNEKIEGFFEVCKAKGLTGRQGVIIPKRNVRNLMLKSEVADMKHSGERWGGAITAGLFLRDFTGGKPWAHLDIAGLSSSENEHGTIAKGGTGLSVVTLLEYLLA